MSEPRESRDPGVGGTNRDTLRHEQVEKDQRYAFAEGGAPEAFDEETRIQTVDMGAFRDGGAEGRELFAQQLGSTLADVGFAILEGHGIDPSLQDRVHEAVPDLFTGHDREHKLRFRARRHGSINQGYFPLRETSDIHPDLVEGWVFCRRAFAIGGDEPVADYWPDPRAEPIFRELCLAQERLIHPIMQSLLRYVGCDPHLFDERLRGTNFGLRLNYYPPLDAADEKSGAGRLLGHEDVDLFTLLPAPRSEGLQVLNRRNFRWIRLDAPPGTIILNTGDYMQRISNDILPSTTHRVSIPRDSKQAGEPRISFPMNVYLWEDESLEVLPGLKNPKYPPVKALAFHTQTTAKYYGDDYATE